VYRMDVLYAACVLCGGAWLCARSKKSPKDPRESRKLDVGKSKTIENIQIILARNAVTNDILIDSMNLMLYQKENPDVHLSAIIPEDDGNAVDIGRAYLSRFTNEPRRVFYFLAGVVEKEMETIFTRSCICYKDRHTIRTLVDAFYYTELN